MKDHKIIIIFTSPFAENHFPLAAPSRFLIFLPKSFHLSYTSGFVRKPFSHIENQQNYILQISLNAHHFYPTKT